MEPQRKPTGERTVDPARRPADEDHYDSESHRTYAVHEPVAATDLEADAAMQSTLPSSRRRKAAKAAIAADAKPLSPSVRRRKLTQLALALYTEGHSVNEIASELGVSSATVTGWFATHRREIAADEIDLELDKIAVPLAKENLIHGLLAGDKQYTLETLKGRGHLRQKDADRGPQELPTLRIAFEFPQQALETDTSNVGVIHASPISPKPVAGPVLDTRALPAPAPEAAPGAEPEPEPVGVGRPLIPKGE